MEEVDGDFVLRQSIRVMMLEAAPGHAKPDTALKLVEGLEKERAALDAAGVWFPPHPVDVITIRDIPFSDMASAAEAVVIERIKCGSGSVVTAAQCKEGWALAYIPLNREAGS